MTIKPWVTGLFAALLISAPLLFADAESVANSLGCVSEIKQVCQGLEEALEVCLAERAAKLSESCRQLLQNALSMAQNPDGPAACVKDIQQSCAGLENEALADCIVQNKANFSARCRASLETSQNPT